MRKAIMIVLSWTAWVLVPCVTQSQEQLAASSSTREDALNNFLQGYLKRDFFPDEPTNVRYAHAFYDLNGDGRDEAIVYLIGPQICGSGGCSMKVFTPEGPSYRVVADTTITQTPIRVLSRSSNGWRSLAIWMSGGGISPREVELRFDGKRYPRNPNVAPRLEEQAPGEVLIHSYKYGEGDTQLFP